LWV
jgi:hypothetical protein